MCFLLKHAGFFLNKELKHSVFFLLYRSSNLPFLFMTFAVWLFLMNKDGNDDDNEDDDVEKGR